MDMHRCRASNIHPRLVPLMFRPFLSSVPGASRYCPSTRTNDWIYPYTNLCPSISASVSPQPLCDTFSPGHFHSICLSLPLTHSLCTPLLVESTPRHSIKSEETSILVVRYRTISFHFKSLRLLCFKGQISVDPSLSIIVSVLPSYSPSKNHFVKKRLQSLCPLQHRNESTAVATVSRAGFEKIRVGAGKTEAESKETSSSSWTTLSYTRCSSAP